MDVFEFVFTFFGLVLGFAVAEILAGFSRALKLVRSDKPVRIGWLTPLLGVFLLLDLISFWLIAWDIRSLARVDYPTLLAMLLIVGTYYLAATLIFPDEPEEWPDYDRWYDRQNRLALGGMLAANVIGIFSQIALEATSTEEQLAAIVHPEMSELSAMIADSSALLVVALLIALIVVKNRRANLILLIVLIALMLTVNLIEHVI